MLADDLGRPRPGRKSLVAKREGAIIEGVLRLEVRGSGGMSAL